MLSLVDSDSSCWRDRTASTLDTIASVGICLGVTEYLREYPLRLKLLKATQKGFEVTPGHQTRDLSHRGHQGPRNNQLYQSLLLKKWKTLSIV